MEVYQTDIVRNRHIRNNGLVCNLMDQQNDHLLDNESILEKKTSRLTENND